MSDAKPEPKVIQLRLDQLRRDDGTQSRKVLDSAVAARYAEDMKRGDKFPDPIVFCGIDDRPGAKDALPHYWLAAGFHRCQAYEQNGVQAIFCKVYEGTIRDAILFSVGENHKHGFQRSAADKRHAVRLLFADPEWRHKTNKWIADKCHVSDPFVGQLRAALEMEEKLRAAQTAPPPPTSLPDEFAGLPPEPAHDSSLLTVRSEDKATVVKDSDESVSLATVSSDQAIPAEDTEEVRLSRNKHGGTCVMHTANIGKKTKETRVKPVLVETEIEQIAKIMAQIVRSRVKHIRQVKALGWTWEMFVADLKTIWDAIPVTTD